MVYAQSRICLGICTIQNLSPLGFRDTNGSYNLGQTTRPYNNKKERICRIVDFAVPADYRVKLKEFEKKEKYRNLYRELKKKNCGTLKWQLYQLSCPNFDSFYVPLVTLNSRETFLVKHRCLVSLDFRSVATQSSLYFILLSPSFLTSTVRFLLHSSLGHFINILYIYCLSCNVTFHIFITLFLYWSISLFISSTPS